jgi:Big-like domain-containing protein
VRVRFSLRPSGSVSLVVGTIVLLALGAGRIGSAQTSSISLSPQDTFVSLDATSYSTQQVLTTYTWPDFKVATAILMKFDLSALPMGAAVQTATLHLTLIQSDAAADTTYTVTAHKITGRNPNIAKATGYTSDGATAWTPSACCYNNIPLGQGDISAPYATQAIDKTPGVKSWDVTAMVKEWMLDPVHNYGLLLNADATKPKGDYRAFASTEYPSAAARPSLDITFTAPDVTPPTVAITAPASLASLGGGITLSASASDNVGVAGVQFKLNGSPLGSELTSTPYALTWDTTTVSDGAYTLTAVARDLAGNTATSAPLTVTVTNGILLLAPQDTMLSLDAASHAAATMLGTYTWPDNKVANAILMKFDFSALPAGVIVQDARLRLGLVQSDATTTAAYTVTANKIVGRNPAIAKATGYTFDGVNGWTPTACCYGGIPLAQADISPAYDSQALDKTNGIKSWNVTTMVQEWLADPSSNFGVLLNSDATTPRDRYRYFASGRYADPTLRPALRISYTVPTGDVTPPAVAIAAPAAGATVTGTVSVTANASDNVGVAGVQFKIDGANLGSEDTTAPYTVSWNTTAVANGSHTLTAVARDAAGNRTTSAPISVTVGNASPPPTGIAALYPGDVGIENDPNVIFVEKFDESSLTGLFGRWSDILNGLVMTFSTDVPAGMPAGSHSLNIPANLLTDTGGHLYKTLAGLDTLYVRYYIKYATTGIPHHSGIWIGGSNPLSPWPDPQAGVKPAGNDRFIAAAEQEPQLGSFDHYDYWMGMHADGTGSYWGNFLLNDPNAQAPAGQWVCVEEMVKLNSPVTAMNGEHAIWLNGVPISHLGQGYPHGSWGQLPAGNPGIFTQNPSAGTSFEGFQWRNDPALQINWIWLQNYSPDISTSVQYAGVVAARNYIGCLAQ